MVRLGAFGLVGELRTITLGGYAVATGVGSVEAAERVGEPAAGRLDEGGSCDDLRVLEGVSGAVEKGGPG